MVTVMTRSKRTLTVVWHAFKLTAPTCFKTHKKTGTKL